MKRRLRRRFVRWYMARVAGRWCPCEWPVKSKRLMHLCGRIDDLASHEDLYDCCDAALYFTGGTSSSSSATVTVTNWKVRRRGHRG